MLRFLRNEMPLANVILRSTATKNLVLGIKSPKGSKNEMLHFVQHDMQLRAPVARKASSSSIIGISRFARNDIARNLPVIVIARSPSGRRLS